MQIMNFTCIQNMQLFKPTQKSYTLHKLFVKKMLVSRLKDAQIGSNSEGDEDAQNIKQATRVIEKHNVQQLSRALGIRVGLHKKPVCIMAVLKLSSKAK